MDRDLIPFENNPYAVEVLICTTCNRLVRIIPAVSPRVLYSPIYNLSALFESLLSYNDYFICYLCCQILDNNLLQTNIVTISYYCFVCKTADLTPVCYLENVSKTISEIFDIPVYNTKYVCHYCAVAIRSIINMYKILSNDMYYCLKNIKGCKYIASYLCQPIILPSTIAKPFGKVTIFDYIRNIHLVDIEYLMRNTELYIEGRLILFSREEIANLIMELESQREVFKYLAEVTRYVSLNSRDHEVLDTGSEYDYVTDVAAITQIMKGVDLEDEEDAYIAANAEIPLDWLMLETAIEEECEEEEIEEFYEGPSCSYRTSGKSKGKKTSNDADENSSSCTYVPSDCYSDSD